MHLYNGNIRYWTPTINNPTGTWIEHRKKKYPNVLQLVEYCNHPTKDHRASTHYFPPVNFLNCYSPFHYGIYLQNITLCQIVNMLDVLYLTRSEFTCLVPLVYICLSGCVFLLCIILKIQATDKITHHMGRNGLCRIW